MRGRRTLIALVAVAAGTSLLAASDASAAAPPRPIAMSHDRQVTAAQMGRCKPVPCDVSSFGATTKRTVPVRAHGVVRLRMKARVKELHVTDFHCPGRVHRIRPAHNRRVWRFRVPSALASGDEELPPFSPCRDVFIDAYYSDKGQYAGWFSSFGFGTRPVHAE